MKNWPKVHVVDHPVVQERLTLARSQDTSVELFRRLVGQIARLMAFEITRDYPSRPLEVETPLERYEGTTLARQMTLVPVLRAGLGMVDAVLELLPSARVGHMGIYRNEETLQPVVYYSKFPPDIADTDVIVVDPMLATAGSLNKAIDVVKETGATSIKVLCLLAAPEGIDALRGQHEDVHVYTASVDSHLNDRGYIVPGLGDAGDRLFGTL
jgi:uracil phosphoribosyltransferase